MEEYAGLINENTLPDNLDIRHQELISNLISKIYESISKLNRKQEILSKDNVSVEVIQGEYPLEAGLLITELTNVPTFKNEDSKLYDNQILDQETSLPHPFENGNAKVSLPIQENKIVKGVYYVAEDDTLQPITTFEVTDNYVKFKVTHFSKYGVVYEPLSPQPPVETPEQPETKPTPIPSDEMVLGQLKNKDTAIVLENNGTKITAVPNNPQLLRNYHTLTYLN